MCAKFIAEVERNASHLAHSKVADELVWKDLVEFKYRAGGVSRPRWLLYPWPVLEQVVEDYGNNLLRLAKSEQIDKSSLELGHRTIEGIFEIPMDVALLKSSGIGKAVQKFLKQCSSSGERLRSFDEPISSDPKVTFRERLDNVLRTWKAMAEQSGVVVKGDVVVMSGPDSSIDHAGADLSKLAHSCKSWRDLFAALGSYDEKRRSSQGARMRERREKLDKVRPKIVKVRHANSRQNALIDRSGIVPTKASTRAKHNIQKIRTEVSTVVSRRGPSEHCPLNASSSSTTRHLRNQLTGANGFGTAVALAASRQTGRSTTPRGHSSRTPSTRAIHVEVGNRRMRIPDSKKASANLKNFANRQGRR